MTTSTSFCLTHRCVGFYLVWLSHVHTMEYSSCKTKMLPYDQKEEEKEEKSLL